MEYSYYQTGDMHQARDWYGHTGNSALSTANNYAVPGVITPNNTAAFATSMSWDAALKMTSIRHGSSSTPATFTYDASSWLTRAVSPHGAVTTYDYTTSPPTKKATTNGRWTKTTMDGFGRMVKVERGHGTTTVSVQDTE